MKCICCGKGGALGRYCFRCNSKKQIFYSRAHAMVQKAIGLGLIPKANTLRCVECGKPAYGYEHRDYLNPLEVEPCCRSCDRQRGAAIPFNGGKIDFRALEMPVFEAAWEMSGISQITGIKIEDLL